MATPCFGVLLPLCGRELALLGVEGVVVRIEIPVDGRVLIRRRFGARSEGALFDQRRP